MLLTVATPYPNLTCLSRIWYEWIICRTWYGVMSHIYASSPTLRAFPRSRASITRDTNQSYVAHNTESCHTSKVHSLLLRITSISHVCHTYTSVLSHMWISHVSHMNQSCLIYELAMSRIWVSHVEHNNLYYLISHLRKRTHSSRPTLMSHVCHTCGLDMSHIWISHISYTSWPCQIYGTAMFQNTKVFESHIWHTHVSHMN